MASPRETKVEGELTELDWLSAAIASLGIMFCCLFALYIGPRFQKMFADFGGELPALTQLALMPWFPLVLGVIPAPMFLSLSASGLCLYGIYGPILAARELVRRLGPDYRQ